MVAKTKRLAIISDEIYRAACPDYENCLSFYGSESYTAILAKAFEDNTEYSVSFFAASGSQPIGDFHPLVYTNGSMLINDTLDNTSLEGLTSEYLTQFDFVLDFSAMAMNIENINQYYGYKKYGTFRNGYAAFHVPRIKPAERNYIVPSIQNKKIYENNGMKDVFVIYYGIPEFYCAGEDPNYINLFSENGLETGKNYYIYPHRPTHEKGSYHVLQLAKEFPQETFVFMVSNNPLAEHQNAILDIKRQSVVLRLENVKFVQVPLNNKHHYFKRELLRHAKAVLSPFNPNIYLEGFGLTNAEAVACGTPILITDSESSRELWRDEVDGLILPYNDDRMSAFRMAIKHFDSYNFKPENRYTVDDCIKNYEAYIDKIINK